MNYDPVLVTCFEGLIETGHPYNFIAMNCIKDMCEANVKNICNIFI